MKAYHFVFIPALVFTTLGTSLNVSAQAVKEKDYYSSVDPRVRLEMIANMRVKKILKPISQSAPQEEDDKDNTQSKIDVVKYLSEKCGFDYTRNSLGQPVRPQVECSYKAKADDNPFNGMTAKFDCTFDPKQPDGKARTLKVKYEPHQYAGGGYKEIPQAVMGTLMARLMGFYTSTYCPVDVICKDCPSENPWENRSQAAPVIGNRVLLENVVVEIKQKGYQVTDSSHNGSHKGYSFPQGFVFRSEMSRYAPRDKALQTQLLTERETLALWINFVRSQDADRHNSKLYCLKSKTGENGIPRCETSIGVINDYGNSFGYSKANRPLKLSDFSRDTLMSGNRGAVTWGASGNSGAGGYPISKAGRDLFVTMSESLTDQQLEDIFNLAQIDKVSDGNTERWKAAYRHKVQRIKNFNIR